MKKALTTLLLAAPFSCLAGVSAEVSLVSDYRFNGVSQTDKGPALQASLDYSHDSGIYLGTWASNVDYGNGDDTNLEWDYYIGYYRDLTDALAIDLGYAQYTYHGADYSGDYDYGEAYVGVTVNGNTTVYWNHASEYFGLDVAHDILKVTHTIPLGDYSLMLTAAHNQSADKDIWAWDEGEASYQDYEVAVSRDFKGFTVTATVMTTSIDSDYNDNADTTFVLGVSRGFELMP
ncbi:TorF family putative porin [Thalassolituus sp. LLYu03]|uniref:TorF family putative porin n=1 Tax=Thalassolituus sp. LLYu03 TaxID=3421656 RepID=UPI003D2CDC77